ncbi:MAG: AAA family ATPase, partial [Oscillospiraceae bacterium]
MKITEESNFSAAFREFKLLRSTEAAAMTVMPCDIAQTVSRQTGIKVTDLTEKENQRLQNMEKALEEKVIGQKDAAHAVSQAIKRGRLGLKDPNRPIGSFLFLGPTGVGKTQLAKVLSEFLFGTADAIIRFDMSEFMEKHSVSKLIGSPPGYAGYDDGGILTDSVFKKPYSVILFDEIEKASPDVLHILLQLLDDGILTDSKGKTASFKNSVIIMTSNIGADKISNSPLIGFSSGSDLNGKDKAIKNDVLSALKKTLKPELLNRVDDIIVFKQLDSGSINK